MAISYKELKFLRCENPYLDIIKYFFTFHTIFLAHIKFVINFAIQSTLHYNEYFKNQRTN